MTSGRHAHPHQKKSAAHAARAVGRPPIPDTGEVGIVALTCAVIVGALIVAYWPVAIELIREWRNNEDYSVCALVPLIAAYLAWSERRELAALSPRPAWMTGALALLGAQAVILFGLRDLYESLERYGLVLSLIAALPLLAGWRIFWRFRWLAAFCLLMVPLPGRINNLIASPLQDFSTLGAVFVLEVFGVLVEREGHVIVLNEQTRLAVAEACSGLRMLTAFVVVAATMAFLIPRPRWQRAVLVLSSVPIAILANLLRLVATATLYLHVSSTAAEHFFHDFAGVTMMPTAVGLLLLELWLMRLIVIPDADKRS